MKTHAETTQSPFERFAEGTPHVKIERSFWITNALVVTVDTDRIPLTRLGTVDNVERVHENYELRLANTTTTTETVHTIAPTAPSTVSQTPQLTSIDPQSTTTYGLERLNAPTAWERTKGAGTRVAVIDTGVDPNHPDIDIDPANWNDWNTDGTERDTAPQDYGSHGTHVSGTVVGGNASGAHIGVAPEAELYHGAALNQDCDNACTGTVAQLLSGMEWAVDENVDVLSMSLGIAAYREDMAAEIRNAQAAGTVVVAASGNSGPNTSISPGNSYDAISVGATDTDDTVAPFSSSESITTSDAWDDPPDDWPEEYTIPKVSAPGVDIISAVPGGGYSSYSGTSMATPHVAGTVALMRGSDASLSPAEINSILATTAVDTGDTNVRQGAGRIDAAAAVDETTDEWEADTTSVFEITSFTAPSKLTAGEKLQLSATITNTGAATGEQTVRFRVGGTTIDSRTVMLEPGENNTIDDITYQAEKADVGSLDSMVLTNNDTATATTTVVTSEFEITSITAPQNATVNETVSVATTITNVGGATDRQQVKLNRTGDTVDKSAISLEPDQTETVELFYQPDQIDIGTLDLTVSTDDDTSTTSITIRSRTHSSGVDQELWDAVTDQNAPSDELTYQDLIDAISHFYQTESIDGVAIEYDDLIDLIEYYKSK